MNNIMFTKLTSKELKEILKYIDNKTLEYRDKLDIPEDITFGIELEYEKIPKEIVDLYIKKYLPTWESSTDASLKNGGEVISQIMRDKPKYWTQIKKAYRLMKYSDTYHNAGGHIHIGANILGDDLNKWKLYLKLYTAYENILYRFYYGDKLNGRKYLFKYARPVADRFHGRIDDIESIEDLKKLLYFNNKYNALNFNNNSFLNSDSPIVNKNTIEFRIPNATKSEIICQNNINTSIKQLLCVSEINEDFLDYKLNNEYISFYDNPYLYNIVNLKNALEFVDLVFDNTQDKIYFLKQYLKNYEEVYSKNIVVKSKRLFK